ncbi:MAG: helix-turn-helix domain-containing protein [Lachnospiraceae bacterium]|nr:helix-turn-helix domain-containing protein [Lachnospiraceae bacterium]
MANKRAMTPFGKEIKRRLLELELTEGELAEQVGTSPQYINHIIFGERTGKKYVQPICDVLEIQ